MLEFAVLSVFVVVLLGCILLSFPLLYALLAGYIIFFLYGRIKGFSTVQILRMSWKGIRTVKNILMTFVLIGMITAVWRDCGTIPFIIYYASKVIVPSALILISFLLCCLVSTLTGTALGTAPTVGLICMTLANVLEINPMIVGGAILSGIYFGDRCSLMSTSALLVSELTGTDIYRNVKGMVRSSLVPFAVACVLYLVLGFNQSSTNISVDMSSLFAESFNLQWVVLLPAILIIMLCVFRVKVKVAMLVSIFAGSTISMLVQHTSPIELLRLLLTGFQAQGNEQLAGMMNGGGIVSMVRVMAIVCLSSCYGGIFEKTGLLGGVKAGIVKLSGKVSAYGSLIISAVLTSMVACNQTLGIMLTHFLCKEMEPDNEQMALNLENTVVVIAPLIPWSVACVVPMTAIGAPILSVLAAFYLYLLPLWNLAVHQMRRKKERVRLAESNG